MKIRPLFDNLVVETKDESEKTKSGFILPSASAEKYVTATVKAVGDGVEEYGNKIAMKVKEGDVVLYPTHAEMKVKVNGEEVTMIRQSDVLAVIE